MVGPGSDTVLTQRRSDPADRPGATRDWHADVAQLVEHHLAKVRVAGSNPVVRSVAWLRVDLFGGLRRLRPGIVFPGGTTPDPRQEADCPLAKLAPAAEWPSGLGKGLQSPVHGFDSRLRLPYCV